MSRHLSAISQSRSQHEENALLERYYRSGEESLREDLIERFLPLARSLALRYRAGNESVEDLIQVASLGLVKALDRFDPGLGTGFHAYAVPTILGELRRHFRDRVMPLHLPRGLKENGLAISRAAETLTGELDRTPTTAEIAVRTELSEEQVLDALAARDSSRTISLDLPRTSDGWEGPPPPAETIGGVDPRLEGSPERLDLIEALNVLDERERSCVRMRFREDRTQEEIAGRIGVSQVHVSRILRRALEKLRAEVGSHRLEQAA
jgi:RNA polymerase sigma-B factor